MKPSIPAVLYGFGLLTAFGAGWFLNPGTPSESITSIKSTALAPGATAPPRNRPAPDARMGSMENWMKNAEADLLEVEGAMQPGVVNQLLVEKLAGVLAISDKRKRMFQWESLLSAMRPEDADAVFSLMHTLIQDGRWFEEEYLACATQWGRIDGPRAVEANLWDRTLIYGALKGWAQQDATAATTWLLSKKIHELYLPSAIPGLIDGVLDADPEAAQALVIQQAHLSEFEMMQGRIAKCKISRDGMAAAQTWFAHLANTSIPERLKQRTFEEITEVLEHQARRGIENGSITFAEQFLSAPWLPRHTGEILGFEWSKDPIAGIMKVDQISAYESREAAAETLLASWGEMEPESLSNWLNTHRTYVRFDQAAMHLSRSIHLTDPSASRVWAEQIQDEALRLKAKEPPPDPFAPVE